VALGERARGIAAGVELGLEQGAGGANLERERPTWRWRASSPPDSATMLRNAITSCCTSASIASMRA
jgi:hypothetical protein